jgi:hypothetical protein
MLRSSISSHCHSRKGMRLVLYGMVFARELPVIEESLSQDRRWPDQAMEAMKMNWKSNPSVVARLKSLAVASLESLTSPLKKAMSWLGKSKEHQE